MAEHQHRFEQKYERSIPSCTVKVWECPCGVWSIRHFGCFNANHDQNSLDTTRTLRAQVARLEAANAAKDAALEAEWADNHNSMCPKRVEEHEGCLHPRPAALSPDAGKGWLPLDKVEQLEKQVAGQKRTLHKLKGKWDKSQLRVKELEGLMAGVGVEAMDEACAALDVLKGVE